MTKIFSDNYPAVIIAAAVFAVFALNGFTYPVILQNLRNENITEISPSRLKAESVKDTVIDVRSLEEFGTGHIEGAVNLDVNSPKFQEKLFRMNRNRTYAVYCKSGTRSATAVEIMRRMGFSHIRHLKCGIEGWKNSGYPVVR